MYLTICTWSIRKVLPFECIAQLFCILQNADGRRVVRTTWKSETPVLKKTTIQMLRNCVVIRLVKIEVHPPPPRFMMNAR